MESLKKSESECERKIELRRKQFGVVLESLSSLKNLIESDTNLEQYLSSQAEMLEHDESMVMMDASNLIGQAAETLVNQDPKPAGLITDETAAVKVTTNEISSSQQTPLIKTEILDDANDDGDDDADVEKSEKHQSSVSLANLANASLVSPTEVEMEDANTPTAAD